MHQPPRGVLDPRKHAVDAPVNLLRRVDGNGQEVVSEESFEDAQEGACHNVAEEVPPEDDAGGRRGYGPGSDGTPNQADENGFRGGHEVRQYVDSVLKLLLQKRQPDSVRLVPPHRNVEPEHGDHHQRPRGVAAGKRPVVHLHRHEVVAVVDGTRPANDLLDDGHEDQIEQERHEQVEEEHAHLGCELGFGRQECGGRTRYEEHAIARKLQGSQKHIKEDPQSVFMYPCRKLPVKLHHMVQQA